MISVIVCSKDNYVFDKLANNIEQTIGVSYELIRIDNSESAYSICEAYNLGAAKSKYEHLCFIHEDISFLTIEWGSIILNDINSVDKAGVIGVAGSIFKSKALSSWWQPCIGNIELKRVRLVQEYKFSNKEAEYICINPCQEELSQVVSLDGVLLFVKKEVWCENKFDSNLLKGFHGYDLDFTLGVGLSMKNYVTHNILIEHYSEGVNDMNWFLANALVHQKYSTLLPISVGLPLSEKKAKLAEYVLQEHYLGVLINLCKGMSFKKLVSFIIKNNIYKIDLNILKIVFNKIFL